MKKTVSILLLLALVFSLAACGDSKELIEARQRISEIGEVSLDNEAAIIAAEEALQALTPEDLAKLENADAVAEARAQYDALAAEAAHAAELERIRLALCGEWVQVGGPYEDLSFLLKDDGSVELLSREETGSWTISDEADTMSMTVGGTETVFALEEKDGAFLLTRDEAVFCALGAMDPGLGQTVTVKLSPENAAEYLGEPASIGTLYYVRLFWWENLILGYYFPSVLYEKGYVYLGSSDDFDLSYDTEYPDGEHNEDYIYDDPFGILEIYADLEEQPESWPLRSFPTAQGEMTFVRREYVEDVFVTAYENSSYEEDKEAGTLNGNTTYSFSFGRIVKLLNGEEYETCFYTYYAGEPLFDQADAEEWLAQISY